MTSRTTPAASERGSLRLVAIAYLGLAALFAVLCSAAALRDQMTVPFADDWRILDHYQSRSLPHYLFGAENGHRLPATLALFALDHERFGGRMRTLVVASIACAAFAVFLFWRVFRKQGGEARAVARSVLAFAIFALFWAVGCNDLLRGIYHMSLQTLALLVLALALLAGVEARAIPTARGRLGLAVLAAFLASWSHGVGVASWAALVAAAAVRRFPGRTVAGLAAAGVATAALYAATLPPDPRNVFGDSLERAAREPAAFAGMALSFVGTAPARVASALGVGEPYPARLEPDRFAAHARDLLRTSAVFGFLGLVHSAVVAARIWRRPLRGAPLDSLVVGLMAFSVAAALLVSFVRYPTEGPNAVLHARFLLWSTLFWIGSACALVPRAPGRRGGARAWAVALALPILSVAMLPALRDARQFHAATRTRASMLTLSLLLGLRNDELAHGVSLEGAEVVYRVASRLEAERRWPFQGPREGLRGRPLEERFAPAPPCAGAVDRMRAVGATGSASVAGWLARAPGREAPAFVVLVDGSGAIRGLADLDSVPPYAAARMPRDVLAWAGFVADYDPGQRYAAWAVLGGERSACPLRAPRAATRPRTSGARRAGAASPARRGRSARRS